MIRLLRKTLALSVLLPLGMFLAPGETDAQAVDADYRLHAGDTLEVSVWREEELQREIIVRPDGKFSFPLTGEMQAAGRTPAEIRAQIEERLQVYIPEPVVTVTVTQVGGNRIYVIGQVKKPGAFVMNPRLNALQALSLAEGATPFAKLDDILIIRSAGGVQQAIRFRYGKVADGEDLGQNILLESGDVVVVP
jgi:polysaccharide export outer membrane protein